MPKWLDNLLGKGGTVAKPAVVGARMEDVTLAPTTKEQTDRNLARIARLLDALAEPGIPPERHASLSAEIRRRKAQMIVAGQEHGDSNDPDFYRNFKVEG